MVRIYHGFVSKPPENKMEAGPAEVKKMSETEPKKETPKVVSKKNKDSE